MSLRARIDSSGYESLMSNQNSMLIGCEMSLSYRHHMRALSAVLSHSWAVLLFLVDTWMASGSNNTLTNPRQESMMQDVPASDQDGSGLSGWMVKCLHYRWWSYLGCWKHQIFHWSSYLARTVLSSQKHGFCCSAKECTCYFLGDLYSVRWVWQIYLPSMLQAK